MAYIIAWQTDTGLSGQSGQPINDEVGAQRLVDYCNERFPDVEHRLEEVTNDEEAVYLPCAECKELELNLVGGYCWPCASLRM